jgi:glycosyltransferase involved in cell wall biosynthesis
VRVIVASTHVPFVRGGGTRIVDDLAAALVEHGHTVDTVSVPFWPSPAELPEQMLGIRLLDVVSNSDALIAMATPSYLLSHPNKRLWFMHHHRGAYDLWDTEFGDIQKDAEGEALRRMITTADNLALSEARRVLAISGVVAGRLRRFNDVSAEVLYPPPADVSSFKPGPPGDYFYYPSRISPIKRQLLAVQAMQYVKSNARLVISGSSESPAHLARINAVIRKERLEDRVEIRAQWLPHEEKVALVAGCRGVLYIPFDEDGYGYVTLEAASARKPVVTCTDAGGPLEFIERNVNGLVADPEPESLAAAMDELMADSARARWLGDNAGEILRTTDFSWENVIDRLLLS